MTIMPSTLALPASPESLLRAFGILSSMGDRISGQAVISGSLPRKEEVAWIPGD